MPRRRASKSLVAGFCVGDSPSRSAAGAAIRQGEIVGSIAMEGANAYFSGHVNRIRIIPRPRVTLL